MKKNILITGVAGMIGSNLLKKIINNNNNIVYGIDNLFLGKISFIDTKKKNFFFYNSDLSFEFPKIINKIQTNYDECLQFCNDLYILTNNLNQIINAYHYHCFISDRTYLCASWLLCFMEKICIFW